MIFIIPQRLTWNVIEHGITLLFGMASQYKPLKALSDIIQKKWILSSRNELESEVDWN